MSLESMFVGWLFANGKLTLPMQICCTIKSRDKVAQLCCVS